MVRLGADGRSKRIEHIRVKKWRRFQEYQLNKVNRYSHL